VITRICQHYVNTISENELLHCWLADAVFEISNDVADRSSEDSSSHSLPPTDGMWLKGISLWFLLDE